MDELIKKVAKIFASGVSYGDLMNKYAKGDLSTDELKLAYDYFLVLQAGEDEEKLKRSRQIFVSDFGEATLMQLTCAIYDAHNSSSDYDKPSELTEEEVKILDRRLESYYSPVGSYIIQSSGGYCGSMAKEANDPAFKKMI